MVFFKTPHECILRNLLVIHIVGPSIGLLYSTPCIFVTVTPMHSSKYLFTAIIGILLPMTNHAYS